MWRTQLHPLGPHAAHTGPHRCAQLRILLTLAHRHLGLLSSHRYEELGENVGSDCSADDFESIFDVAPSTSTKKRHAKLHGLSSSSASSGISGGLLSGRSRGSHDPNRAVEKASLLTDVDVLVS